MNYSERIEEIKNDIIKFSPNPKKVKILPATKYVGVDEIRALYDIGINTFGENRVQALQEKKQKINFTDIKWHFIGKLQRNKVKYIVDYISLIHSVDKLKLAKEINKRADKAKDILLEINISGEESKSGYSVEKLFDEIDDIRSLENINVKGLMTMAPFTDDENIIRNCFKNLYKLQQKLNREYFENTLTELSMGMTNDYKIALEEGATIIRIGSKIFK